MKFTFLGTGTSQGVPVIGCNCAVCKSDNEKDKRLRTSLLVQKSDTNVCIDIGPDFRQQMLRENISSMDALIITHEHMDHVAGLDEVRAFNFLQKKRIPVFCTQRVQERLKEQFSYIFTNPDYPGVPQIEFVDIANTPFYISDIEFIPIKIMHGSMPLYGFRIEDFTYITDANYIEESEKEKIFGSKVLVLNALRKERHHSHFSLDEAITLARECGAKQTYFTHISHQMGKHAETDAQLPEGMALAYDGLTVEI